MTEDQTNDLGARLEKQIARLGLAFGDVAKLFQLGTVAVLTGEIPARCEDWISVLEVFALETDMEAEVLPDMIPLWEMDGFESLEEATTAEHSDHLAAVQQLRTALREHGAPAAWAVIFKHCANRSLLGEPEV